MAQEEEAMDLCETSQVEVVVTSCEETNGIDQPVYDVEMDHASDKPETSKLEQELTQIPEVEPKHVFEIEPKPTLVTEPVSEAEREQEPTAITDPASMVEKNPASIIETKMIPVAMAEPTFTEKEPVAADEEPVAAAEEPVAAAEEPVAAAEKELAAAAEKEPATAAEKEPATAAEKEPATAAEKELATAAEKEPATVAEKEPATAAEKEPATAVEKEPATAAEKESVAGASEAASASEKASFSTTAEYSATAVQHEAMDMDVSSVQGTCEADDISDRTEREQEPTAITNPASMIEKNPASINQTKMIPVATVEPTFTAPKEPMAAAEKEPVAAAEKEPVAAAEKEPVAAAEKEPVAAAEKELVAAAEKEPVAAADKEPVAAADKEPVAGASEAASASEKASFSTTAQDSATAVQHEAMDTDVSNVQDQQMNENEQALEPCEEVEEPAFPKTLEEFGYYFNEDGQLRSIENDEPFQFVIKEHDHEYNQQRYEALGEVITEYVYKLLEEHVKLERKTIPVDASNDEPQGFFFMSPGALEKETLLLLIHGSGVVRAGQWSRKLIINNDLEKGTQLPYIKSGLMNNYGVIVLNTNQNSINGRLIRGSESPENHALYVWDHFVLNSSVKHLAVVAHSYGGIVTTHLADRAEGFRKYAFAIAFTDSVHGFSSVSKETKKLFQSCAINWVSSNKPLDTELHTYGDCKRLSAGHQVHEWTSYAAMESVFRFIEEKYKNIEKDNGKNKKQCTFI